MEKQKVELTEIKIAGISCRTNNANEMNQDLAQIGKTVQEYFKVINKEGIKSSKNTGVTYCVYTDYATDYTGDYTFVIGQEVSSFEEIPSHFAQVIICAQEYTKFTTESGVMPNVCVDAWKRIWQMSDDELEGRRSYKTDLEIYDLRAADSANTILDIYIGVSSK